MRAKREARKEGGVIEGISPSDHDPLDLVQADLVARPIVELGRPRGFVTGDALGMLR